MTTGYDPARLVVFIDHIVGDEDDPTLTDSLGEHLRSLEAAGIVLDFRFERVADFEPI